MVSDGGIPPYFFLTLHWQDGYAGVTTLKSLWDFAGGTVDRNLPANARDTGLVSGLGRSRMQQSNY